MQKYQSQLPIATVRYKPVGPRPPRPPTPPPAPADVVGLVMKHRLQEALTCGYWYCLDCEHTCEPVESDQGQPNKCNLCGSVRVEFNPPTIALVPV
jgi:hypothetical protein